MAGRTELLVVGLLVCALLVNGCIRSVTEEKAAVPRIDEIKEIPVEQRRASLLGRINRKFEDPDTHFQLGELYQAEGRWDEAEYHYDVALSFDPVYWPAQAARVKVLQASGEPAKAQLAAEIFMNQAAASAERLLQLGRAFQKQDLGKYALACYEHALRLEPKSAKITKQIGYYYLSKGDKARAEEYFRQSFNLDRLQPDVALELGKLEVTIEIPQKNKKNTNEQEKAAEQARKEAGS